MIIAGTGHRPTKIFKTDPYSLENFKTLRDFLRGHLRELQPSQVISGMALGFDMALGVAAILEEIPLVAAVPFRGQESVWPKNGWARSAYSKTLAKAKEVIIVSEGGYSSQKMMIRNQWMVDHCDLLVALWDGKPGSGTDQAIDYALRQRRRIVNLWSEWSNS